MCIQNSVWKKDWYHFRRSFEYESYAFELGRNSLIIHMPTERTYTPEFMLYLPDTDDHLSFPVGHIIEERHGDYTFPEVYVVSQNGVFAVSYDRSDEHEAFMLNMEQVCDLETKIIDAKPADRAQLGIVDHN